MPKLTCVERWRAEIVVVIVLPISFVLWMFKSVKRRCSAPSPALHDERVLAVASAVRSSSKLMRTDRSVYESHSVRNSDKSTVTQVPLRSLRAILSLSRHTDAEDNEYDIIHVEPGATVGEVSDYLLKQKPRSLQLECCLEMEDATLGGLAMAQGMTTHSHVCGLLSETVIEYEIVVGDGRIVVATETNEHERLFRALPMSHGSLGLLVSLKLRVVPAKPYVRLTYQPLLSVKALQMKYTTILNEAKEEHSQTPFFVEAIAYTKETSVLMTGELVDHVGPNQINYIGRWYKPWFFKHVESMLQSSQQQAVTEYIPLRDYLMRHDRSMCMTMATVIPYGNHPVFRYLLGWLLPPQMSFLKSSHTAETREASARKQCYQDVAFPADKFQEALSVSDELFNIYPLLVYPCKVKQRGGMLRVGDSSSKAGDVQMNLNLGIYGVPPALQNDVYDLFPMIGRVRKLENWLRQNGGFQHTYCDSFQTEQEFEAMFDHTLYNEMRTKYRAKGKFPRVYEKTRPEVNIDLWLKEEEDAAKKQHAR
jgi:Delta24-sterol reductase